MSLAQLEEEKAQYIEQLEIVLSSLKDDPDSADLHSLKEELQSAIAIFDESIAELRPSSSKPSAPPQAATGPPSPTTGQQPEKWQSTTKKPEQGDEQQEVVYRAGDTVMAKWVSGDKAFYQARITSVTGSASAPMYTVKFKTYDTVETLRAKDIRPVGGQAQAQKRRADGTPVGGSSSSSSSFTAAAPPPPQSATTAAATGSAPPPPQQNRNSNGVVLSASPSMYPAQQGQSRDGEGGGADGKPAKKFKKIKANKELEAGKNKWQDFNSKSKFGKTQKKDSMFRTPEGVNGRVGFTGSGQAMRKDASRTRHVYQPNEDVD